MTKKHGLSVKITEECYQKLSYIARKDRRPVSGMARYLILEHIRHFEALFGRIEP